MVALIFAIQFFGLMAALQTPIASPPVASGDEVVALTFATTRMDDRPSEASAILIDINLARRSAGLAPLARDERLNGIALVHARDMLTNKYVSHTSLDGATPYDRMRGIGYPFSHAGENIALNVDRASAERALMASEPHRRNILDPHYTHIGIAAVETDGSELIVVQDFSD